MSDTRDDDSSTGPGPQPGGLVTTRADGPEIPSGYAPTPAGTVRGGGPDIPSGFAHGQSGTAHSGGPDISSGFGPVGGSLGAKLNAGDPLVINEVTYRYERVLSKSTGEAEIFLLCQDGQLVVFKLYYQSFKPKQEILAPLKQLKHQDIINVIDYGYYHDRFFEIMEYAKGGTLEQYLPIRDLQRLRSIISETVNAFKFCHARGVVHRDIKPENIYCRDTDGTDFVIGDFGISSALDAGITRHLTSQNLTAGYAAPEMYGFGGKVIVGREVDYYALGITLIHLWQGKSPFDGLTIHYIANLTTTGAINVPNDLPDALQTLIRGLITFDLAKRWGHDEVQRWLNGEDVPVHVKEITYPQFQFDSNQKASSPVALARMLKANPDKGKKLLYSGKISAWVNLFDPARAAELDRIVEDEYPKSQDAGLQKTIYVLDPDEPFTQANRKCRTPNELATELEDQFDFYLSQLTNPSYSIYLYLEAHENKKEADAFRAYFRTFSAKKALNTIILELAGRESVTILGTVFNTSEAVLQARQRPDVVNMLKDRESKLSLWMEGTASKSVNAQLNAWRALKICDATTLSYVSDKGDGVPQIGLSKNAFSFTDLKSRSRASDSFEIRNTGGGRLTGSITTNKNWLRLAQTKIDSSRKSQTISFSIDTTGLPFGATDTAAIEVHASVGIETVSVAIAIEHGTQVAARFRRYMTLGGAAVGAALGFAIHRTSSIAGVQDPSSLAGLVAVLGLAIEGWEVARKSGKPPLRTGVLTLLAGLLVFGFLEFNFPLIYSVASWALLFMVIAYVIAPSILVRMQTTKNRKAVPIGVLAGAAALSVGMIFGDTQVNKWISHGTGNAIQAKPAAGELSAAGSIAALTRYVSVIFRESPPPSGRSSIRGGIEWTRDWGAYIPTTRTRQTARLGLDESGGPTLSFFEHSIFGNAKSDALSIAQLSQCVASKGAATCSATLSIKGMAKFQSMPSSLDLNLATGAGVFSIYLPGESVFVIQLQGTPSSLHDAPGWLSKAPVPPPPPPPDESKKDNRPPTVAMAQDQSSGCRIWKPNLAPNDAVTWSGACVAGLAEGHGTAKWTAAGQNTLTYEGTFRSGLLQGRGKMTAAGGDSYEGEYREGKREGRGVYISSTGDRYEGDFRNNKREGSGMLTRADGTRVKGHFIDGKPVADTGQQAVREPKVSGAGSAEEQRKPAASDATAQADYQKALAIAQSEYQQTVSAAQASYEEKKAALQRVSQRDSSEARTRLSLTQSTAQAALEIARQGTNNPTALAFAQNLYNQSVADALAKYDYENSARVAQFYQMAKVAQAELSASTRAAQATLQQRKADAQAAYRLTAK